jgi:GH25 family lysozyme M1 (1,4-beta-N-acetylmuramidase)
MRVDAVDVASYQHPNTAPIHWDAVRASGVRVAIVKATGEGGYTNPFFGGDWSAIHAAGFEFRAAYHFLDGRDPTAQAQHFAATVGALGPGDLVALDVEPVTGRVPEFDPPHVCAVLAEMERATGRKPLLYMGYYYRAASDPRYSAWPLWLPSYGTDHPRTWRAPTMHQWTSTAAVPGIPTPCDGSLVLDWQGLSSLAGTDDHHDTGGDDMITTMGRDPRDGTVWEFWGLLRRHVATMDELALLQFFGVSYGGDIDPRLIDARAMYPPVANPSPIVDPQTLATLTADEIAHRLAA